MKKFAIFFLSILLVFPIVVMGQDVTFTNDSDFNLWVYTDPHHHAKYMAAKSELIFDEWTYNYMCWEKNPCKFFIAENLVPQVLAIIIFNKMQVESIKNTMENIKVEGNGAKIHLTNM